MRRSSPGSITAEIFARRPKSDALALTLVRNLAFQDWWVIGYFVVLIGAALAGSGPTRDISIQRTSVLLVAELCMLMLVRGHFLRSPLANATLYRLVTAGTVQLSYFVLRALLPVANHHAYDAQLTAIDVRLFGVEPTLWVDRFVSSATTEWFSFFYFGYFFVLGVHFWPIVLFTRDQRRLNRFALSSLLLFCTAHVFYMIVPGYGPYAHLAGSYQHALPHGYWYDVVLKAVAAGGAQKDIFPSLHTAAPTMIAFYSFRNRDILPYKYTWPIISFIAVNIVGATIFLRWHYAIDVVTGLCLAFTSVLVSERLVEWEIGARIARGVEQVWPRWTGSPTTELAAEKDAVT